MRSPTPDYMELMDETETLNEKLDTCLETLRLVEDAIVAGKVAPGRGLRAAVRATIKMIEGTAK